MITVLAPTYFTGTFGLILEIGAIAGAAVGLYYLLLFVKQNVLKKPGNLFTW